MKTTGRDQFRKFKPLIVFLVKIFKVFGRNGNVFLLKCFRNTNGKIGILLRYILLKNVCKKVGDNVSIHPGVYMFNLQNVSIGDNVSIHPMCYLEGAGGIQIGNNVSIAHASSIISTNHTWSDPVIPIKYNKEILAEIVIKDDVWIGAGVRVLAGVTVHERSIIAAGAVVNKKVESKSIYGGVPAIKIKDI